MLHLICNLETKKQRVKKNYYRVIEVCEYWHKVAVKMHELAEIYPDSLRKPVDTSSLCSFRPTVVRFFATFRREIVTI